MNERNYYRIILVDDHEVFRLGLKTLIKRDPELKIVGEAKNGKDLFALLNLVSCDLVILDLLMPEMDGFAILEELSRNHSQVKRLVLSMNTSDSSVQKALRKGIDGFINKEEVAKKILTAIQEVRNNKKFFSNDIQEYILSNFDSLMQNKTLLTKITAREEEVAGLIASGMSNKEVASTLNISNHTVQFHRSNLMRKLNLKNTADLVKFAIRHDLFPK
ncbi:response regulator transcription factor [bacterium]|nr:response regulator transcription factor [bacterium]